MDRPLRIGLCSRDATPLQTDLRALPGRPEVEAYDSIFSAAQKLLAFQPDALFVRVSVDMPLEELAGAVRLLRSALPQCAVVLLAARDREIALSPLCARVGAHFLAEPYAPAELLAAFDHALRAVERPRAEVFLDLVHGIADEINNPLMFLMGHLQLLQLQLDPTRDRDHLEQIAAALGGAQRIHETVERMRRIEAAAAGPRRADAVDVWSVLHALTTEPAGGATSVAIVREPADASFAVLGDAEILRPALSGLVDLAREFKQHGTEAHFAVARMDGAVRVRLALRGKDVADWSLPRTYEPYYLARALRGSPHGLALFHVQAAAHGHRGRATARLLPDATVAIDMELPLR